jgi:glycosyltransferase involved in cell wall biosynthesis
MVTVSVLFPVHNENDYVEEALQSIMKQDFTDLEILVLDSTRASIYANLQKVDSRIRYIRISETANLSVMLNIGIRNSRGKFIARMDSDDISLPHRITSQVRFMMKNPEVMILGGGIRFIGKESSHKAILGSELNIPQSKDNYFEYLLYKNPIFHPTVMFRSSIFTSGMNYYNEKFERSQDLELWVRLCRNYPIRKIKRRNSLIRNSER